MAFCIVADKEENIFFFVLFFPLSFSPPLLHPAFGFLLPLLTPPFIPLQKRDAASQERETWDVFSVGPSLPDLSLRTHLFKNHSPLALSKETKYTLFGSFLKVQNRTVRRKIRPQSERERCPRLHVNGMARKKGGIPFLVQPTFIFSRNAWPSKVPCFQRMKGGMAAGI